MVLLLARHALSAAGAACVRHLKDVVSDDDHNMKSVLGTLDVLQTSGKRAILIRDKPVLM